MIRNIAENTEFYCMNDIHPEPILFIFRERSDDGRDNFFACPKYMTKDEKHPDGHEPGEQACANRLSFSDAGDIISKFNKIVDDDMTAGNFSDYNNFTFMYKNNIKVKVLEYGGKKLKFGIYNKKAIESK